MPEDLYKILGVPKKATTRKSKRPTVSLPGSWDPGQNPAIRKQSRNLKIFLTPMGILLMRKKRKLYDEFGEDG